MFRRSEPAVSYYKVRDRLLAGRYPGGPNGRGVKAGIRQLLDEGVTFFVDLTETGEKGLPSYERALHEEAKAMDQTVKHRRMPIPDFELPTVGQMRDILGMLDGAIAEGHTIYVHCYAGVGRTGTVIGSYLVHHGRSGIEALDELVRLRRGTALADSPSPVTDEQRRFVYEWATLDTSAHPEESDSIRAVYDKTKILGKAASLADKPESDALRAIVPRKGIASQASDALRTGTLETPPVRPRAFARGLKATMSIVGVVAVVALLVVTLAVSAGQISLPVLYKKSARADREGSNQPSANLQAADLSAAKLVGANLGGANLSKTVLVEADLHYALLNEVDLREADLRGADLQWADLTDANLSGAQLEGASLKNARLEGAILPDGSQWTVSVDMRRFTDPEYQDFWRP